MCLAIPTQIIELLDNQMAITSLAGVKKEISLALLTDEVKIGDYVIVHAGYALKKTPAYFAEILNEENYNEIH